MTNFGYCWLGEAGEDEFRSLLIDAICALGDVLGSGAVMVAVEFVHDDALEEPLRDLGWEARVPRQRRGLFGTRNSGSLRAEAHVQMSRENLESMLGVVWDPRWITLAVECRLVTAAEGESQRRLAGPTLRSFDRDCVDIEGKAISAQVAEKLAHSLEARGAEYGLSMRRTS